MVVGAEVVVVEAVVARTSWGGGRIYNRHCHNSPPKSPLIERWSSVMTRYAAIWLGKGSYIWS